MAGKVTKKAKSAAGSKSASKKSAVKATSKVATEKANVKSKESKFSSSELASLDRKTLAGQARKLKLELMAIRFNIQSPSLKEYKKKRKELASVLSHLG
jgi:hypothetical protein